MKKFLFLVGMLGLSAGVATAQDNVIKANILSPLVKTGSFFYERKISDKSSLQLGMLFTSWKIQDTKVSGFAVTPEYRFYLSEKHAAPEGFYVGPFLRYQNLTLSNTYESYDPNTGNPSGTQTAEASLNTFGGGMVVGRHWIFKERFSLDIFLGPSYNGGSLTATDGGNTGTIDAGSFQGFSVRTGITFGIAF